MNPHPTIDEINALVAELRAGNPTIETLERIREVVREAGLRMPPDKPEADR